MTINPTEYIRKELKECEMYLENFNPNRTLLKIDGYEIVYIRDKGLVILDYNHYYPMFRVLNGNPELPLDIVKSICEDLHILYSVSITSYEEFQQWLINLNWEHMLSGDELDLQFNLPIAKLTLGGFSGKILTESNKVLDINYRYLDHISELSKKHGFEAITRCKVMLEINKGLHKLELQAEEGALLELTTKIIRKGRF